MPGEPALEVRDLRKSFGRVEAVAGVSFRVGAGEIVGFLGPNGAGKTTTMRILAGIFPPTAGEVRVAGHDLVREPLACRRVALARALLGEPPILLLDEPTIGLDPAQVVEMRELLAGLRGERTVFFSSHVLAEVAALCERVIVIARGRLVAEGGPGELARRLGGRRRIVLKVDGPPAEVAGALGAVPGVLTVEPAADGFVVEGASEAELARAVGEAVKQRGWTVLELRHETPGLEEVF